jgi:hypothetical protein
MTMTPEIQKRAERLERELSSAISHANLRARVNHWIALVLIALALLSSAAASLGAFTRSLPLAMEIGAAKLLSLDWMHEPVRMALPA